MKMNKQIEDRIITERVAVEYIQTFFDEKDGDEEEILQRKAEVIEDTVNAVVFIQEDTTGFHGYEIRCICSRNADKRIVARSLKEILYHNE